MRLSWRCLLPAMVVGACVSSTVQASCGTSFCGVNTQWDAQGIWDRPGLRADLRFEFVDQDQPRHGSDAVAVGAIHRHHDEQRTINRNTLLNLDYGFDAHWGVAVTLPYVSRTHDHIHNHHGHQLLEAWDFAELGDVRVVGRYRFTPDASGSARYGVKFGLKLPTGDYELANSDGDTAERTLQPGSGTTELILGAFYQQRSPASPLGWFAQLQWQQPLNERADYRPGYQLGLDVGLDYALGEHLNALLQANLQIKGRDAGTEAERADSGSRHIALSPGLAYAITPQTQVYAFVQLPVYQYYNGVQLSADVAYVAGVNLRF